ncbi:MAG: hypothetical protein ISR98_01085 [Parcubacteria group bacterium]|nr:hypothetical protein [Parcubacteria group bacterium]
MSCLIFGMVIIIIKSRFFENYNDWFTIIPSSVILFILSCYFFIKAIVGKDSKEFFVWYWQSFKKAFFN